MAKDDTYRRQVFSKVIYLQTFWAETLTSNNNLPVCSNIRLSTGRTLPRRAFRRIFLRAERKGYQLQIFYCTPITRIVIGFLLNPQERTSPSHFIGTKILVL